jgi:hypothetical protein
MHGDLMYEIASQRIADLHRSADRRRLARQAREGRGRRGKPDATGQAALAAIPDYVHELFDGEGRVAVPPQGRTPAGGGHARTSR